MDGKQIPGLGVKAPCGICSESCDGQTFSPSPSPFTWKDFMATGMKVKCRAGDIPCTHPAQVLGQFSPTPLPGERNPLTSHFRLYEPWWNFSDGPWSGSVNHRRDLHVHTERGRGNMHRMRSEGHKARDD